MKRKHWQTFADALVDVVIDLQSKPELSTRVVRERVERFLTDHDVTPGARVSFQQLEPLTLELFACEYTTIFENGAGRIHRRAAEAFAAKHHITERHVYRLRTLCRAAKKEAQ